MRGIWSGVKNFMNDINLLLVSILLLVVYFLGVGLTSIFAIIFKKHFLDKNKNLKTYWSDLNLKEKPLEEYYEQF